MEHDNFRRCSFFDNFIVVSIRKLFLLLALGVLILLAMHFFPKDTSATIHSLFNLDRETNIPTWYSTILLFSVAFVALTIYYSSVARGSTKDFFWLAFGLFYLFLSADEMVGFHEIIDHSTALKWIVVYAPFCGLFFVFCVYYFIKTKKTENRRKIRKWILTGLVVYAIGGMGGEFLYYRFYPLSPFLQQLEIVFEEGLEMFGTIIVLIGCLKELGRIHAYICKPKTTEIGPCWENESIVKSHELA